MDAHRKNGGTDRNGDRTASPGLHPVEVAMLAASQAPKKRRLADLVLVVTLAIGFWGILFAQPRDEDKPSETSKAAQHFRQRDPANREPLYRRDLNEK
jgi:hypothetical protein